MAQNGDMLVAAPERWDEACFAVPAVRALQAAGLDVGVACQEARQEFWQTLPGISVVAFDNTEKPTHAASRLRGRWQAALLWEPGFIAETIHAAGITRRLGAGSGKLTKYLTHPLTSTPGPLEHRVRFYLSAVEELGVETSRPEFFAPATLDVDMVQSGVLLSPDSDFGRHYEWPVKHWVTIGKRLLDMGFDVTVADLGGACAATLAKTLGDRVACFTSLPLGSMLTTLAGYRLVISADSSLPHLAAHAGATCVTLFGPNDPTWKRPLGRRHEMAWRHTECAPCLLPKCPMDLRCQHELEPEAVWNRIAKYLGNTP